VTETIGQPYVDLDEFKDYMKMTGKDQYDDLLTDALASASKEINRKCQRQFGRTDTASTRTFNRFAPTRAIVSDFYTTDDLAVTLDGSVLTEGVDYELHPLNGVVDDEPGWPWWKIHLNNGRRFYRHSTLQVTARWGWAAVPDPVKQACKIMAAETYQLKDAPLGVAGLDAMGGVLRVRDNPMARSKLFPYMRSPYQVG
jgi:hypothetical protein